MEYYRGLFFFSDLDSGEKTVSLSLQVIAKYGVQSVRMRAGLLFRGSWRGRDPCKPHEFCKGNTESCNSMDQHPALVQAGD